MTSSLGGSPAVPTSGERTEAERQSPQGGRSVRLRRRCVLPPRSFETLKDALVATLAPPSWHTVELRLVGKAQFEAVFPAFASVLPCDVTQRATVHSIHAGQ